ncbi:MAG: hypothetical protein HY289_06600 [Planctomycetes bacterium]|nr:hypothetical protein [Planctomycetota bacterium]
MTISRRHGWLLVALLGIPLLAGCELLQHFSQQPKARVEREPIAGAPSKYSMRVSQFVFMSDVEIRRDQPIFRDLGNLREQVNRELKLPPSTTEVFVYLFEDKARYDKFIKTKHPDLPPRRAFFVAQPRRLGGAEDLMVYTYMGERLHQDLRHELTHALLHCALKNVPIWLDEGLAEYFEVPVTNAGINPQHLEALRLPGVRFDMERLERLEDVHQMSPLEYRESWAWVHLMLRSSPQAKEALLSYLRDLRINPNPGPLRPRLAPAFLSLEQAVQTHLTELDRRLPPSNVTASK